MATWTKEEAAASLRQLQELGAEAERLSAVPLTEEEGRWVRSRLATCSPSAGRADILRREGKRWWRLEQKAALRRDYLAAYEYAALSEKYHEQADAAERENNVLASTDLMNTRKP